ncbi:ABC transporter permease [Brucella anthropi]|uniref:ABC transporter permease n=1 Tax=Brucella anthropi TaxID=529 RepID=UPI001CFEB759|nr:ABC transporter permease [Brucella anthropi]
MSRALKIYAAIIIAFLIFPILLVVPLSFSATRFLAFPPTEFSFRWYEFLWNSSNWKNAAFTSLIVASSATIISVTVGTLAALTIANSSWLPLRIISALSFGPQIVPSIIIALGALIIVSKLDLYGSYIGLIAVHATLGIPFVLMIVTPALRDKSELFMRAARSLGASPLTAFLSVILPMIIPSMVSSAIFVFFVSFDELIIALFLMGGNETLPMRIWADLRNELTPAVAAVSTLLIAVTLIAIFPVELYRLSKNKVASNDKI